MYIFFRRETLLSWALVCNSLFEELVFFGVPLFYSLGPWNGNLEETQTKETSSKEVKGEDAYSCYLACAHMVEADKSSLILWK